MRAAVMPGPDQPVEVREIPIPELEPGGILLRTIYSEICGTDCHLAHGRLAGVPYPIIPGHVSVGRVDSVRGDVRCVDGKLIAPGDVVTFLDVHETCNSCWYCLVAKATTRCPSRRVYGVTYSATEGPLGGWGEFIYLKPGVKVLRLPASLPPERLIAGGCALPTAIHAIDRAELRLAETVAVQGAGPVGLAAAILARLSGAGRVIIIDQHENRLEAARAFGVDDAISLHDSPVERVRALTDGRGVDVTIEATGAPVAVPQGIQMTRDGGRYVIVGHYTDHGTIPINPHLDINKKHLDIRGTWGVDFSHFYRMVQILDRFGGKVADGGWERIVSRTYGLGETNQAIADVEAGRIVKGIIDPQRV